MALHSEVPVSPVKVKIFMFLFFLVGSSSHQPPVNKPDAQRSTVRSQASSSLDARAFFSDVEPQPLS